MRNRIALMVRLFALAAAFCIAGTAWSDTETVGGYTWTYRINGDTAEIYNGDYSAAISPKPTDAVVIPSTLGDKPVTSIGNCAFYGCSGLTSVTIPDSVTSIGASAFCGCSGLTSVTIPDSVTSIGNCAFLNCSGLTSVTIPGSVTSIGYSAFDGCSGLTSVTIPDSVTSIGYSVFRGCSGLTSVTIPDSVTSIGNCAFLNCSGLTSVTIPDSVTSIGDWAFEGCSGLTSVTIPNSVKSIGNNAFSGCNNIKDATVPGHECGIPFGGVTNLVISAGTTSIGPSAFYWCSSLTSVTIPDGVTSIGNYAFYNCSKLTSVTIPDSVTSIGNNAFYGCSWLTGVAIPDSVTSIGYRAFYNCSGLTSVTIPDSVTSIGNSAFSGCNNVKNAEVPGHRCGIPFGNVTNLVISAGTTSIGDSAFYNCSGLTSVTIPDSVTSIGDSAFYNCSKLTSVTIPDSVTSIGNNAFKDCSGIENVYVSDLGKWCCISFASGYANPLWYAGGGLYLNGKQLSGDLMIPDGVTSIGNYAFYNCRGLTSVTIPDSVTSIGDSAFDGCSGLTSVTIPDSVTSIGNCAFLNCSGLTSVTIPDSVTSIGDWAFDGCSGLTSVTIPDSVTSIGDYAFRDCSGLTSVTIPHSVTSIAYYTFSGCNNIKDATVPGHKCSILFDGVTNLVISAGTTSIGPSAFYCCSSLTSVTIPDSVTSIGYSAFEDCSRLTSVTIGDGVTSIGYCAFEGCSGLTSVTIPDSVTSIGDRAFLRCGGLTNVTMGCSVTYIAASAFKDCSNLKTIFASVVSDDALVGAALTNKVVYTDATTDGDAEWARDQAVVHSGVVSWKSGSVSHNQESWFEMDVDHPGRLSFWWKASSESDGADIYDYAYLSVDGEAKGSITDVYRLEGVAIGGKTDWVSVVIDVTGNGPHKIRWTYCKDESDDDNIANVGEDCVWLDDIVWTPCVPIIYDIGGASGVAPFGVSKLAGTTLALPDAAGFSWEDHVFDGWSDGKKTYLPGDTYIVPRTDVIFTAQWIRKSALTFTLNGGSGSVPATIKEVPGTKVTLPLATGLSRAKHTFAGWSDGVCVYNAGVEYVIGDLDVAFTAVWTAHTLSSPVISSADVSNGGTTEAAYATISMSAEAGTEIHYTMDGSEPTAASPRYAAPFVAAGMNVTIKAIAVRDNYFDSDVATFSFTRKPYSLSECLGLGGADVTTGGDSAWGRVLGGEAYDSVASLKSGTLGDSQTNWVQIVVSGPGTVSFWWNVSSEGLSKNKLRRDGCLFTVDGEEKAWSDGITNYWTQVTVEVSSPGVHTLKWAYGKNDNSSTNGCDCAWLAEVVWTQGVDPSVPHWSVAYENLKGAENPNPDVYYEGYGVTFQPLSDISGYTFAGWTPSSIPVDATGDKIVTANWNWIPEDATVEASITGGKVLNVDAEWVKTELVQRFGAGKQQTFITKFGDNFAAALTKKTGKFDGAGKELSVWHDYVAGTDPTDANSTFKAKIEFKDGMPVVAWEPNLNSNGEVRVYTVYGKADLGDAWHSPTNALDHFFKVDVAMPQSGNVTFNVGGGSSVDPIVVRVGQPIGDLPTPTRQGYDFLGWFTAAEGGTEITPETVVADDMTIFAHWEKRLAADLVHRWSFNGDLTDSVGGQTATKVGRVITDGHKYSTPGGSSGSAYIDLGNWILPTNGSPVTIEMWVTQDASVSYGRIFCWGAMPTEGVFTGSNKYSDKWIQMRWDGQCEVAGVLANIESFSVGKEYHVATVLEPIGNGNWKATYYAKDAVTGATLSTACSNMKDGWSLQEFRQTDMVLGQTLTSWDPCSKNSYNELRIWKKAMTEEELTASAIAGPDAEL